MNIECARISGSLVIDEFQQEPSSITCRDVHGNPKGYSIGVTADDYDQYVIVRKSDGSLVTVNEDYDPIYQNRSIKSAKWIGGPTVSRGALRWGGDHYQIEYEVTTKPIEEVFANKENQLKSARTNEEFGTFAYDGEVFQCRSEDQARIAGRIAAKNNGGTHPAGFTWTTNDNKEHPITAAKMVAMGLALDAHVMQAFANYKIKCTAAVAARDAGDVAALVAVTY